MVLIEKLKDFIPLLFWIGILLLLSAFFSLSETALISLSKIRLRHMMSKGTKNAKLVHKLISKPERLITSILVGNNLVNTAISVLGATIFVYFFPGDLGLILATIFVATIILVFGEILPKVFAVQRAEKVSLAVAYPINFVVMVLTPVAKVFNKAANGMIKIFGGEVKQRSPLITEEEIRLMIEVGKEEGVLGDEERKMLHRIFEFGDTVVSEVMVPKEKMVTIDIEATDEELLNLLVEEGHARVPVYKGSTDNIVGLIHARDLLYIWQNKGLVIIPDLVHPAYFVPKNKRVNELLMDFQKMRIQMAIVIDEDKKALGLVTLEDLTEEIVGEIDEERSPVA
ncbi:MAG: hemolysin family protein [Candidatus Omnitrophota bacterium]|nr:hemolysin family protein [Candidatus Omnitrophota bacterium]